MQFAGSVNPYTFSNNWGDGSIVDFSGATFVEPVALAGTVAVIEDARRTGQQVSFIKPQNQNIANYMSRIGFGAALDSFSVAHDLPSVNARPLDDELLELQSVSGEHGGEQVASLVATKLRDTHADPQVIESLHSAICETVGNIEFHAEVDHGFVVAQTIGRRIYFAIADSGVGLKGSLSKKMLVNDDRNAIELATVANVTATEEVGRGQGLPDVVQTALNARGTVTVATGLAIFTFSGDNVAKRTVNAPFQGTLIQVSLPV